MSPTEINIQILIRILGYCMIIAIIEIQAFIQQTLSVPSSVKRQQFTSYPPTFIGQRDGILPVSSSAEFLRR